MKSVLPAAILTASARSFVLFEAQSLSCALSARQISGPRLSLVLPLQDQGLDTSRWLNFTGEVNLLLKLQDLQMLYIKQVQRSLSLSARARNAMVFLFFRSIPAFCQFLHKETAEILHGGFKQADIRSADIPLFVQDFLIYLQE